MQHDSRADRLNGAGLLGNINPVPGLAQRRHQRQSPDSRANDQDPAHGSPFSRMALAKVRIMWCSNSAASSTSTPNIDFTQTMSLILPLVATASGVELVPFGFAIFVERTVDICIGKRRVQRFGGVE